MSYIPEIMESVLIEPSTSVQVLPSPPQTAQLSKRLSDSIRPSQPTGYTNVKHSLSSFCSCFHAISRRKITKHLSSSNKKSTFSANALNRFHNSSDIKIVENCQVHCWLKCLINLLQVAFVRMFNLALFVIMTARYIICLFFCISSTMLVNKEVHAQKF